LTQRCWRTRAYGDFWSYMLLAEGGVDIALEPSLALHDMAALSVIVEEAGGRFTGLDGVPGPLGSSAVATNGRLHEQVLAFVGALPTEAELHGNDLDDTGVDADVHELRAREPVGDLGPESGVGLPHQFSDGGDEND
jgi:histidinol-phosphatase